VQRWLDRAGLDYVTRPITDDDAAAARSLGITAAPIVAHGDTIFGGFDPNRLEQLRKA
jgi:glutaredoxin